ncbi:MAG: sugar porter family MFS transporter [Acidobacteriaceae bacterium]
MKCETTVGSSSEVPLAGHVAGRTWPVYLFGSLGSVLVGYNTGIIAGAILLIRKDMALTPALQGLVVGMLLFGAMIGAFGTGRLADRLGPRKMLIFSGLLFIVTSLGSALAFDPASLIGARMLAGIAVGAAQVQVPLYVSEMAPKHLRGALTSLTHMCTGVGIFSSYLTSYLLAPYGQWRLTLALAAVPAAVLSVGMLSQPDSPRWLVRQGRRKEALKVLQRFNVAEQAEMVLDEISAVSAHRRMPLFDILRSRSLRAVLFSVLGLAILQQFMGINTVVYYTPTILRAAGFSQSAALLNGVGFSMLSIIMTLCSSRVVDRLGRRPLLLIGAAVMGATLLAFGVLFQIGRLSTFAGAVEAITVLALFKAAFSFTWGPVVWVMMPELLPLQVRARGMSAAVFCFFFANFIVSTAFPVLLGMGALVSFGLFAGFCVLAFLFVTLYLPETAGLSLEEIEKRSG